MPEVSDIGTRITTPGSADIPSLATLTGPPPVATPVSQTQAPTPEQPEQPEELPPWDAVKQTDAFKNANDAQRAVMLNNYSQQAGEQIGRETAGDDKAQSAANEQLKDFYTREQTAIGERYSLPENAVRALAHSGIKETTALIREHADALNTLAKGAEDVAPGVITTRSDIRNLTVDQAKDQLAQQQDLQKQINAKQNAAEQIQILNQESSDPQQAAQLIAGSPASKLIPGGADEAGKIQRSPGYINQRISDLQNYIKTGGDPNVVPEKEADPMKPFRKLEKWGAGQLAPDAAFAKEHPFLNSALENTGYVLPFLGEQVAVGAMTGGLGLAPEAVGFAKTAADATAQVVDTYSQSYQGALAKIDDRIKAGEAISPQQREQMARDDASMNLFNVPFMTFSNMLVGRVMASGVSREVAQPLVSKFVNNVLVPGLKETATQTGVGIGVASISALSDQMSGVSKEPVNWGDVLKQGAAMGVSTGALGMVTHAGHAYIGEPIAINRGLNAVRAAADAQMRINPNQNQDDVHERLVKQLPPDIQDSVRAKLGLQKAADIQREASAELDKTGSEQTKAVIDQGITETEQQDTTPPPPKPAPMTPEQRTEMGEGLIHQALANGHINDQQHAGLIAQFEQDPTEALNNLGGHLGFEPGQTSVERLAEVTKNKTPNAIKEPAEPTAEPGPAKEAAPSAAEKPIPQEMIAGLDPEQTGAVTKLVREHGLEPAEAVTLIKKFGPIGTQDELVSMARRLQRMKKVSEPAPAPVPAQEERIRSAYDTLKAEQGGLSAVSIGKLSQSSGIPVPELHDTLRRMAGEGNADLHPTTVLQLSDIDKAGAMPNVREGGEPYITTTLRAPKEAAPKEAAPEPGLTPETNQNALFSKVADYLGPEAMGDKTQKLEFGRDFLAQIPQQDRPAAAQLLHRLHLESLGEDEHANWAGIPKEQQGHMMALMSRFIDNRTTTEGMRHADKPIFKKAMTLPELQDFVRRKDAEGLQNRLKAGQTLAIPIEQVENDTALDEFLADNGFSGSIAGDQYVFGPSDKVKSSYELLKEKYQQVLASQKGERGRPMRQEYKAKENSGDYDEATKKLPEHPAEDAEIEKVFPEIERRFPSDETGELTSAARNKYVRQLRLWTRRMMLAGRSDDMQLIGQRTKLQNELRKLDPDSSEYLATKEALKLTQERIKETDADRPVLDHTDQKEHKHPHISPIITDIDRDYQDWRKKHEAHYGRGISLQMPRGEGAKSKFEEAIGEYQHEPTMEEGVGERRAVTPEDEDHLAYLDVDHQAEVGKFADTLRTNQEKANAYYIANRLAKIMGRPEVKPPEDLAGIAGYGNEKLLTRITDEYTRYLAQRHEQSRPAGEGGEEGRAPTAIPTGGGVSPADYEETAAGGRPQYPAGGGETDSATLRESSALTAHNQGSVAERQFTPGQYRGSIAGLPERTTEDQARATDAAARFGAGATGAGGGIGGGTEGEIAPGAGAIRRDAITGERIHVTPEGAERSRHAAPTITPDERRKFDFRIEKQLSNTANRIWQEKGLEEAGAGTTGYAKVFGLNLKDFSTKSSLRGALREMVTNMVKQEPTLNGRLHLANDILLGIPQFHEEAMSASQQRRQKLFDSQTTLITSNEQIAKIRREAFDRYKPGFAALGVPERIELGYKGFAAVRASDDGTIDFIHNPSQLVSLVNRHPGITEGQLRGYLESVAQEEMIHAAQLSWYKEQWKTNPGNAIDKTTGVLRARNFSDFLFSKSSQLMDSFEKARDTAFKKGNYKLADDLDNALGSSVYHYFRDRGAEAVTGWDSYNEWLNKLTPEQSYEVHYLVPIELARQITQLRLSGQTTEFNYKRLLNQVHDLFMGGLRHLRQMALRVTEGSMGQAWKDTITTLENRVRILQQKIDAAQPPATVQREMFANSQTLALKLGQHFFNDLDAARMYNLGFQDATSGPDFANKLMRRLKARFGDDIDTIHAGLHGLAVKEGLIKPTEYVAPTAVPGSHTLYVGTQASLAPGISDQHVLDEGEAHQLARYFRYSNDPDMRQFAKSLTSHREKLMPVVIRQLNNDVPAAFYHDGDLFVSKAALNHVDGQKAIAHELQHAVAQQILTNPKTPVEHDAAAHAHMLVDQFRAALPADIRDAADHKLPAMLDHMDANGRMDIASLTDEERRWLPLMEAAQNPSEFAKKAFSSANFRDFLRNTKGSRGESLWDKTHQWGRTIFGNEAFRYAPEVSDITYNRPGAVMKSDPRTRNMLSEPSPRRSYLLQQGVKISNWISDEMAKLPPDMRAHIESFERPYAAYKEGTLTYEDPKNFSGRISDYLMGLFRAQELIKDELATLDPEYVPPLQRFLQKYGFESGAQNVLRKVQRYGITPTNQKLASVLANALEKSDRIDIILKPGATGAYNFVRDNVIVGDFGGDESKFQQTLLHEATHALVSGKLSAYLTGRMDLLSPEEKTAIGELENLRQTAVNWGIKNQHIPPDFTKITEAGSYEKRASLWRALASTDPKRFHDTYGLMDLNEFASEAFSNPAFQDYLKKIPFSEAGRKPTTMWGKFLDWVKGLLGIRRETPEGNAFDATMESLSKTMEGPRLMTADFKIDGATGPKTSRQAAMQMLTDHLEQKAEAEGYASVKDVPQDTLNSWASEYKSETTFTGQFTAKDFDGIIGPPKRSSTLMPSQELAQKTTPEDIVDHVARVTGTDHLDSEALRKAIDRAYDDETLSPHQFIGTQSFLDDLDNQTLRHMNPLGGDDDPNSPARRLKHWGRNFLAEGNIPKEFHDLFLKHIEYAANELSHKGKAWVDKFNKLIKTPHYGAIRGPRFIPERTMEQFNDVLAGRYKTMPKGMSPEMWNHLREGRKMIDDLSDNLLKNGIAKPDSDLYLKIEKSLGHYLSRSYRLIQDPRYTQDEARKSKYWAAAIAPMKKHWVDIRAHEAAEQAARVYRPGTSAYEEARIRRYWATRNRLEGSVTDKQVEQHMTELLQHYGQTAEAMQQPAKTFGPSFLLNDKIVTDLTKMPKEFRQLMGEEKDVRTNLVNTLFRQNRYLHTIQLAKDMYEAGRGQWFGDEADPAKGLTHQIAPEVSFQRVQGKTPEEQVRKHAIFGKLAGKWTTKEINDFINGYDKLIRQDPSIFGKMMNWAEGSARYLTTIASIHRGVGNLFASGFSMMQNGMLPLDPATARGTMAYLQHMFGGSNAERDQRISEALRYGVLDKNIDQTILNDMMRRGFKYAEYGRGPLDFLEAISESAQAHPIWSGLQLVGRKAQEFALKFHTAGNDIAKMAQWEAKQRFLRDVDNYNVEKFGGPPKPDEEIKQEAAQIVRDTNISYSLASPALKKARAQPYFGTFLTYWNEMARSYLNQLNYAQKYIRSRNPVERMEGIRRVAGIAIGASVASTMAAVSRQMFGVTDRKDRQLRALLPPWEQNDTRLYLGPEKNGNLAYINLNYIMPQGDIARGLMALLTPNSNGPAGNVFDAGAEIFHPVYNVGLIPGAGIDVLRNQTEYGTQIYNPDDDLGHKAGAISAHLLQRWGGGTIGRLAQTLPQIGKVSPGGNIYDPYVLATKELLGQDIHYISIPDRFRSSLFGSSEEIKNAQKIFNSAIQHTGNIMTDDQMKGTYLHMERIRYIEFSRLHDKVEAALDSGMSLSAVRSMMRERGYSRGLTEDVLAGRYHSYRPGKTVLENARHNGNIVPRSIFSSSARDYEED